MAIEISSALLLNLMRATWLGKRHQICGILRGRGTRIVRIDRAANIAQDPAKWSEIDPPALNAARRSAERKGGLEFMGFCHSSTGDSAKPSARDAARALDDRLLWLSVTKTEARLWRVVPDGMLFGRFTPVEIDLVVGKQPPERVKGVRMRGSLGYLFEVEEPPPSVTVH